MSNMICHLDIRRDFPAPVQPQYTIERWQNGLAVRMPNWLGDAVMALPALRQLKRIVPEGCALGVITPASLEIFYRSLPWVDLILPLESAHRNWSYMEIQNLRRFTPGAGVLFNNSFRDAWMMRRGRVHHLYGTDARFRSFLMKGTFHFPKRHDRELHQIHHANRYLAMASALGAPAWDGTLPEIEIVRPRIQLPETIRVLCDHPRLLVLAAGGAYGAAKRWKNEHYRQVAQNWIDQDGIVITVGSPSEAPIGEEILQGLPREYACNMMGKTDLAELMHLLQRARGVVANDSGVMHLAAALGRPGVAVFGSTDYTATGPIHPGWEILYAGVDCAPCFCRVCPKAPAECMEKITADMVTASLQRVTASSGTQSSAS